MGLTWARCRISQYNGVMTGGTTPILKEWVAEDEGVLCEVEGVVLVVVVEEAEEDQEEGLKADIITQV